MDWSMSRKKLAEHVLKELLASDPDLVSSTCACCERKRVLVRELTDIVENGSEDCITSIDCMRTDCPKHGKRKS